MAGYRNKKGTVAVKAIKGVLRLVWSYQGQQCYLYCGLADTPLNRVVAEGKAKVIEGDLATGNYDTTLAKYKHQKLNQILGTELFQRFTENKKFIDKRTLVKYKGLLNKLTVFFGCKPATNFTEADVEKFYQYLSKTIQPVTCKERVGLLKACWDWGIKKKLVADNPWSILKIRVPPKQKPNPFTYEEIHAILSEISKTHPHYRDFVEFLFGTGCRTGEAVGLRWRHLTADCSQVWFGEIVTRGELKPAKRNRDRTVLLTPRLQQLLLDRRPLEYLSEALVFPAPQGGALDDHNYRNRIWKPTLAKLNIPYRKPYNTRHTLVSHALEKGVSAVSVAEITGHSVKTLYQHYAGAINKTKLPDIFEDAPGVVDSQASDIGSSQLLADGLDGSG